MVNFQVAHNGVNYFLEEYFLTLSFKNSWFRNILNYEYKCISNFNGLASFEIMTKQQTLRVYVIVIMTLLVLNEVLFV